MGSLSEVSEILPAIGEILMGSAGREIPSPAEGMMSAQRRCGWRRTEVSFNMTLLLCDISGSLYVFWTRSRFGLAISP